VGPILLTGATGFVGAAVHEALLEGGLEVRGTTRDVERARHRYPDRTFVRMALDDPASLREALRGCWRAVYLVHSMHEGEGYEDTEREAALRFREAAAAAGVDRIVYLGAMPPNGRASTHLRSRLEVGEVLRGGPVETIELQASMIMGTGSESFRMVRDLAVRLPAMVMPSWSLSRTEPIGIRDVVAAIVHAVTDLPGPTRALAVPGPEVLSAREIIERTAHLAGLRPFLVGVPFVTPRLSSHWVRLVSRSDYKVAREIIEGLRVDIVAPDQGLWQELPGHARQPFDSAVREALAGEAATLSPRERRVERAIAALSRPWPWPWTSTIASGAPGVTGVTSRRPRWPQVVVLLAITACWGLLLTQGGRYGVHRLLGPLSLAVLAAALWLRQTVASERGWPTWAAVVAGAALGAVMTLSTYPAFALVSGYLPGLSSEVAGLYQLVRAETGWLGVAWTASIVLAEEWIWREALFTNVRALRGTRVAVAVSLALYALVQLGTGSWIVVALGVVCGACWTAARVASGTILTPAVAHLVWTMTVLVWRPVV
jgi:uncharacterized protein YbjT (DUF2867 family)/membrane protease YdiL (CAAX protease family)